MEGRSFDGARWDAAMELALSDFIARYLEDHPAPAAAVCAADLSLWAENLRRDAQARLEALAAA